MSLVAHLSESFDERGSPLLASSWISPRLLLNRIRIERFYDDLYRQKSFSLFSKRRLSHVDWYLDHSGSVSRRRPRSTKNNACVDVVVLHISIRKNHRVIVTITARNRTERSNSNFACLSMAPQKRRRLDVVIGWERFGLSVWLAELLLRGSDHHIRSESLLITERETSEY